jgi:OmpA-OmpF porin, OOP family
MNRIVFGGWSWAVGMSVALASSAAHAQVTPGTDTNFDAQVYWPMAGPGEHLAVRSSTIAPSGAVGFGLIAGFTRQPLLLRPAGATQTSAAIDWAVTTDFLWNVGIWRRFQVSAAIPVVVAQSGDGSTPVLGRAGSTLTDTALRDLRVEASWAILQRERLVDATGLGLRLDLGVALPFGDEKGFNSSGGFTFAPTFVADYRLSVLTFTANVGARLRQTRRFADIAVGNTLVAAGAIAVRPGRTSRLNLTVDYHGTFGLAGDSNYKGPSTHEVFFGARYATDAAHDVELLAGAAVGLGSDATTPGWRGLLGLSYAPRGNDTDHDGIVDADDRCIDRPEDRDDFEDDDGCPDDDNDNDNVADSADRCPNEPEDADNFQDEDGCPDDDNDSDGVSDTDDECPLVASGEHPDSGRNGCPTPDTDSDGVLDPDDRCVDTAAGAHPDPDRAGCPTPDDDNDGVANREDACPNTPAGEHPDRWRPGCADPDLDRDGVTGDNDRCPEQAETINGVTDTDGCPDTGAEVVTWDTTGDAIRFGRPVVLAARAQSVSPLTLPLVVQAAQRVRGRGSEVARVFVEVMPGLGAPAQAEATRLAGVVRDVFIAQRIPSRNIVAQAATRPTPQRPAPGVAPRPVVIVVGALVIRVERRTTPVAPSAPAAATPSATPAPAATPAAPTPAATPAATTPAAATPAATTPAP